MTPHVISLGDESNSTNTANGQHGNVQHNNNDNDNDNDNYNDNTTINVSALYALAQSNTTHVDEAFFKPAQVHLRRHRVVVRIDGQSVYRNITS
jgi:hypothetical protein